MKNNLTVGIDIGGTNTVIGFVDYEGKFICESSIKTNSSESFDKFIVRLTTTINKMLTESAVNYTIAGIGIAAPCGNYFEGTIEAPSNINWGIVNIVEELKQYFDVPIAVTNDANAAAMGEQIFGKAKGMRNFIVLTLGTGVGSGIVIDETILYGENGLAGELGHAIVDPNGRKCSCGKRGCLETYISANGFKRTVFELIGSHDYDSDLKNISFNEITAKNISDLALKGDLLAIKTFEFSGEILGRALADAVAYLDPQAIILFGGLVNAGDLLLKPTEVSFQKHLLGLYKGKVKLLSSDLQNGKAAVLGASSLVLKKINKEAIKVQNY